MKAIAHDSAEMQSRALRLLFVVLHRWQRLLLAASCLTRIRSLQIGTTSLSNADLMADSSSASGGGSGSGDDTRKRRSNTSTAVAIVTYRRNEHNRELESSLAAALASLLIDFPSLVGLRSK